MGRERVTKGDIYLAAAFNKLGLKKMPEGSPKVVYVKSGEKVTKVKARR